jgi:hypothetical protein
MNRKSSCGYATHFYFLFSIFRTKSKKEAATSFFKSVIPKINKAHPGFKTSSIYVKLKCNKIKWEGFGNIHLWYIKKKKNIQKLSQNIAPPMLYLLLSQSFSLFYSLVILDSPKLHERLIFTHNKLIFPVKTCVRV